MNAFEKALQRKIQSEIPDLAAITPGVVIEIHYRGRKKGSLRVGETYRYYDLASLTKIIFTASYSIGYFSEHPRELRDPVKRVLPWWKANTPPFELLSHTAGLDWWKPYYKKLSGPLEPEER